MHIGQDHIKSLEMIPRNTVKQDGAENPKDKTETSMGAGLDDVPFRLTRPLVISMMIFGLLHFNVKDKRLALISKVYAVAVLLILWGLFFRSFSLYSTVVFELDFLYKAVLHLWLLLSVSGATTTYLLCRKKNLLICFLQTWSDHMKLHRPFGSYIKPIKRSFFLSVFCVWVCYLISCGLVFCLFFKTGFFDILLGSSDLSHMNALLTKYILSVLYLYVCAAWLFTPCLFYHIITIVNKELMAFREDFQNAVGPNGDIISLGNYRKRHQSICRLVEEADNLLSGYNAVSIVVPTLKGMLILYNMVWYKETYMQANQVVTIANIFCLTTSFAYLFVIAVGGGYLNHLAHSPLMIIHNIRLKTVTTELSLQMTMFLSKLTGESIGLTAWGMFVIDRQTIITIGGAFVTYFIVLVQFHQPTNPQGCLCNCTVLQ